LSLVRGSMTSRGLNCLRGVSRLLQEFFISYKLGRRVVRVRISTDFAGKVLTRPETPGLACPVLRNPLS